MCQASSDTLECQWLNQGGWRLKPFPYYCHLINFYATQNDEIIVKVITPHHSGKTGSNVDGLYVGGGTYHYLPSNIPEFFPNLKAFWIYNTGLKEIKPRHISSYSGLREFSIENCLIEVVEKEMFAGNPALEFVSFANNKIKSVGESVLNPLNKNIPINFSSNLCVSKTSGNQGQFNELQRILSDKCPPKPVEAGDLSCKSLDWCGKIASLENDIKLVQLKLQQLEDMQKKFSQYK